MIVRELAALLSLKVDQGGFKTADRLFDNIGKTLGALGLGIGGLFSGSAVLGAISGAISEVVTATAHLAKTAPQLGMSTEELQKWEHAAKATGGSAEDIQAAAEHVGSLFNSAGMGSAHAVMSLAKFGVSARKASGEAKTFAEIFEGVANSEKFQKAPDGLKLSADFREVFGGTGLLALARKNASERAELLEEVAAFGATFSKEDQASAAAYRREMSRTGLVMLALKQAVAGPLTDTFATATKRFNDWVKSTGGSEAKAARSGFEQSARWVNVLAKGMEWLYRAGTFAAQWMDGIVIIAGALVAIPVLGWISSIVIALASGGIVAMIPWALVIAGFIALGIVIDDVWGLLSGGESVIGRFFPNFAAKVREIKALFDKGNWEEAFNKIGEAWIDMLIKMWDRSKKFVKDLFSLNPSDPMQDPTKNRWDERKQRFVTPAGIYEGEEGQRMRHEAQNQALLSPISEDEKNLYKFTKNPVLQAFGQLRTGIVGDSVAPGLAAAGWNAAAVPQQVKVEIKIEGISDPILVSQEVEKKMDEFYQRQAGPLWNPRG